MGSVIDKVVEKFHEKFYPEVKVAYIGSGEETYAFIFSGPFCLSCGVYDYFEDFAIILSEYLGKEYRPIETNKVEEADMWIVIFGPANKNNDSGIKKSIEKNLFILLHD